MIGYARVVATGDEFAYKDAIYTEQNRLHATRLCIYCNKVQL
jgi:hypothetical protein